MTSLTQAQALPGKFDGTTAAALITTIIVWASAFPAIRAGLAGFGPLEMGAVRFAIAAVPAALFLLVMRPALPSWREAWRVILGGLFFVALYTALLNIGEQTVAAGPASFIINVSPIITAVLAMTLLNERFGAVAWLGTAISFAGIFLIALGTGDALSFDFGALLILGSAFCNSITAVVQKPLFARHKPLTVSAWNLLLGALFLAPALPNGLIEARTASSEALGAVIFLGLVPSFIAYGSWAIALSRLSAARASNFLYCVPPVATAMGYLWLGEVPSALELAGGILALGGVVVVNLRRRA